MKIVYSFWTNCEMFPVSCFFRFKFFLDLDLLRISCGCVVKSCACQLYIKRIYDDDDDAIFGPTAKQ